MFLRCQNFVMLALLINKYFQESPTQEETSAAEDDEEYNSPMNKIKFPDFEEDEDKIDLMEESNQNNHEKVKQVSKKVNSDKDVRNVGKRQADFQREILEKQLEAESKEKEQDRVLFLELGKMLKKEK